MGLRSRLLSLVSSAGWGGVGGGVIPRCTCALGSESWGARHSQISWHSLPTPLDPTTQPSITGIEDPLISLDHMQASGILRLNVACHALAGSSPEQHLVQVLLGLRRLGDSGLHARACVLRVLWLKVFSGDLSTKPSSCFLMLACLRSALWVCPFLKHCSTMAFSAPENSCLSCQVLLKSQCFWLQRIRTY